MPLAHEIISSNHPSPQTAIFSHGIMGRGQNLKTFAKLFLSEFPGYQAVLIDLRHHGNSGMHPRLSGEERNPNTIQNCAQDIVELMAHLDIHPHAIIGHSYSGKVAIAYAELVGGDVDQVWSLDCMPNAFGIERENRKGFSAYEVAEVIKRMPKFFTSRSKFVETAMGEGLAKSVALFLTTSLKSYPEGLAIRYDMDVIMDMIQKFEETDLTGWIKRAKPNNCHIHLVQAMKNRRWNAEIMKPVQELEREGKVKLHELNAGHWVHSENPKGLIEIMRPYFREISI